MYERCLSEAERVLAAHKEVMVTVKTVWHEVVKHAKQQRFEVPSIADFTTMLEADNRFEFVPAHQSVVETVGLSTDDQDVEELELESLGFFGEDCVKLKQVRFVGELDTEEAENGDEGESVDLSRSIPVFPNARNGNASRLPKGKTKKLPKNYTRKNGLPLSTHKRTRRKILRKSR